MPNGGQNGTRVCQHLQISIHKTSDEAKEKIREHCSPDAQTNEFNIQAQSEFGPVLAEMTRSHLVWGESITVQGWFKLFQLESSTSE